MDNRGNRGMAIVMNATCLDGHFVTDKNVYIIQHTMTISSLVKLHLDNGYFNIPLPSKKVQNIIRNFVSIVFPNSKNLNQRCHQCFCYLDDLILSKITLVHYVIFTTIVGILTIMLLDFNIIVWCITTIVLLNI